MPIPRLLPSNALLLVIDIQEAFVGHVPGLERIAHNAAIMAEAAGVLDVPVIVTEHYPSGLGRTLAPVREGLPAGTPIFEKTRFSACVTETHQAIQRLGRPNVLLCGIEAHVCILQTALDLLAAGFQTFHLTDAIGAGQPQQIAPAFRRMERAGSLPGGTMSAIYELMADARNPSFKTCLSLVKRIRAEEPEAVTAAVAAVAALAAASPGTLAPSPSPRS